MLGDEQLVDHSGVFRVTSAISQAQAGHEEGVRRPGESLVGMAAMSSGGSMFDDGPTLDDPFGERTVDVETEAAEKRARLNTLAARAKARNRTR